MTRPSKPKLTIERVLSSAFPPATYEPRVVTTFQSGKRVSVTVEAPTHWGDDAVVTVAEKYLRRVGVPSETILAPDAPEGCPDALRPRIPAPDATFGPETSVKQALHRLAGAWAFNAFKLGYCDHDNALAFYAEVLTSLERQMASPNSPQWFNTGLAWAYGIKGGASGLFHVKPDGTVIACQDTYSDPQVSACFIQSAEDSLVGEGGIMDLWYREAKVFKGGSGSGVNVSKIRAVGERLSNGGVSSGVMDFLDIGDKAAGAIKSGGTTRRAAKMVCIDDDHPEVMDFVRWKLREEHKVAALVVGSARIKKQADHLAETIRAHGYESHAAQRALDAARIHGLPSALLSQILHAAKVGTPLSFDVMDTDWQGEAYQTVSGQNSNNTVRLSGAFLRAMKDDAPWTLTGRVDSKVNRTIRARGLWDNIIMAAWASADPGLHFKDTIDDWNTCPEDGNINASNPCSEYLFLDDTACNLASQNLVSFLINDQYFDAKLLRCNTALWTVVLEVSVAMGGYPTEALARNSWRYRTLGLGIANLGGLLMRMGMPYDSDKGRYWARAVMALINAQAYRTSAQLAYVVGPYEAYARNAPHALRVLSNHRACAYNDLGEPTPYQMLGTKPMPVVRLPSDLYEMAQGIYDEALEAAKKHGLRNAQLTVCAPTGTISFQMGCDTTGCEPDFALVKHKSYAGGGSRQFLNASIRPALRNLSWNDADIDAACAAIEARGYFFHQEPFLGDYTPHDPDYLTAKDYELAGEVLACAAANIEGVKTVSPMGHLKMMAALQPHISGALSKTVNLPHSATLADIADIYRDAYDLGIKALAVYRDGSKLSQVLTLPDLSPSSAPASPASTSTPDAPQAEPSPKPEREYLGVARAEPPTDSPTQAVRMSLPALAESVRVKATLAGRSFYLHTGEYADGRLGEVFVTMGGQGGDLGAWIGAWAQSVSVALQHGTPFSALARSFLGHQANPSGFVHGLSDVPHLAHIRSASSPMDLIFQVLGAFYDDNGLRRDREPASPSPQPLPVLTFPARLLTAEGVVVDELGRPVEQAKADAQEPSLLPDLLLWVEKMQMPPHERPPALTHEERLAQYARVQEQAKQPHPLKPKGGGDLCPNCNSFGLRWSGNRCQVCDVCHTTTGCS